MSYANGTTHYNLPQTVSTDKRDWTDTNQAFADVDAALHTASETASTAASNISTLDGQINTPSTGLAAQLAAAQEDITSLDGRMDTAEGTITQHTTDISDVRGDCEDMVCAYNEPTATSAHAYSTGDFFIYNDILYKATDDIAIGDTIVPNTNCSATNVTTEVDAINTALSGKASASNFEDLSSGFHLRNAIFGEHQTVHCQRVGDYIIASFNGYTDVDELTADEFVIAAFPNDLELEIGSAIGFINADGGTPHTCTLTVSNENHNIRCNNPTAGRYFNFDTVFKIIS